MAIIKIRNAAIDLDAAEIPNLPASKITSGTIATARLGSGTASNTTFLRGDQSYQTLSEFNDDKLVNDISTLALHQATNNNSAKYNLTNSNVDVYQDSSAIANLTNVTRNTTGEYISSVSEGALNGSYTDFSSSNFASVGNWTWSGNNLTINSSPDNDDGTSSGTGSTPISFGTGRPFRWRGGANYSPTGINPWFGLTRTSSDTRVLQLDASGEMYFNITTGTDYGFYAYDSGSMGQKVQQNYGTGGYYFGVERDNLGIIKAYHKTGSAVDFTETPIYTFSTNYLTNTYYLVLSGTGGRRGDLDNLQHDIGSLPSTNATGSYESTAQTANTSVNKISAVVTYTNASGTNTLNTDIVLQVSADNGSNWSNATLTSAGTFSTGVLQAVTNDVSVTAGTQLKYKISFANQASGSKVARINGVSLSY
jgi:hypothetical protein